MSDFVVCYKQFRIKVRPLPTENEVHSAFPAGAKKASTTSAGFKVNAFYNCKTGWMFLPIDGHLEELVPHEVTHAVLYKIGEVHCNDDESAATAIGILTARILKKMRALI
jgi:hypothetical protein